ncbi:MAG: hypothetical protein ACU0CY_00880 [Maritimibacter harenae]|jgi:hypothetical protein|uniref:Cytochrome C oxidase assembly protein n=1 Tax=Maritimibacter harenae TaxID=2606218 RepID=A0A845LXH9_9RHOB|nr:hypothetical protein [Maritimibacter harenae]MZR12660.1 hypothetical protein [Maritimibacter harenae]
MDKIRATHELHQRRLSRNVGLGIVLVLFIGIVYGLTIAKVGTDPNDELGAEWAAGQERAAK